MEQIYHWLSNQGLSLLYIIIGSLLAYFIGSKVISFIIRAVVAGKNSDQTKQDIRKRQKTLDGLIVTIWKIIVIVVGVYSTFEKIFPDVNLAPIIASAGVIGVAIAFGAQSLAKDCLSGFFIVSENQYRVGDVVSINEADGKVERVGIRTTVIRDNDGNVHYLPNGSISHVINKTMGYSKVRLQIAFDAKDDLEQISKLIDQTGNDLANDPAYIKYIIEAPKFESIGAFNNKSVNINISGKVQPSAQWIVTAELRKRLLDKFNDNNIDLA